jgi:subtilisin family serine protease
MNLLCYLAMVLLFFSPEQPGGYLIPRNVPLPRIVATPVPAAIPVRRAPARPIIAPAPHTRVYAIIDGGVDCEHPWLQGRCIPGQSFVDGVQTNVTPDFTGHGTQIAGIIAARNTGAVIMPLRLADSGRLHLSPPDIAAAIYWATDHGAQVIVAAVAGSNDHGVIRDAVAYACSRGIAVYAPAGNFGLIGNDPLFPAAYPCATAVGALDAAGKRAVTETWASNSGPHVRVWRLGVGVPAPLEPMDGTSAAVAIAAAELAR